MLAGRRDALAELGIAAGLASALPQLSQSPVAASALLTLSAAGAGWLTWKRLAERRNPVNANKREGFTLRSDPTFPECIGQGGIRLGFTTDHGKPIDIADAVLQRHICIVGMTGVGKTVLGEYILWQQIARGGGFMFIDAKLDKTTRDKLAYMMRICGREDDFMVINTTDPDNSNTYNPVLYGEGDEVSSRLLSVVPSTDNSPGADHFKQQANQALTTFISALKESKRLYHFGDLSMLLTSPRALDALTRLPGADTREARSLEIFLENYRSFNKETGQVSFDMKRVKETFGGIAGRIGNFAQGNFGKVFNTYTPEIDLYDVIVKNKCLYVMLPTMAKNIAAVNLAKMIVSDLRSAVARVQDLPISLRPNPPFVCFLDEFGSYVEPSIAALFEQARSAKVALIVGMQSFANLSTVSEDFAEKVIQNTLTKIFFKFASKDAENAADILGMEIKYAHSLSAGTGAGETSPLVQVSPQVSESDTQSISEGWREAEAYRVSPVQLRNLQQGECVIYSDSRLFHARTAMLEAPSNLPEFKPIHHDSKAKLDALMQAGWQPCGFEDRYREYLTASMRRDDGKDAKPADGSVSAPAPAPPVAPAPQPAPQLADASPPVQQAPPPPLPATAIASLGQEDLDGDPLEF